MKGYKGMSYNMVCRDMQYHLGTLYIKTGQIDLCHSGYHFCKNLQDVFKYYPDLNGNRFFEVEAGGTVITGEDKCVASVLRVVRELNRKEICRIKYGNSVNNDDFGFGNGYPLHLDAWGDGIGEPKQYTYDTWGNGTGDGELFTFVNGSGFGKGINKDFQRILIYI